MSHLSNKDLLRVLDAVEVLNSGTGMRTLPERTLRCAMALIPNSTMTAFDGLDPEGAYDGSLWYSPPETVPQERVELLAQLVHEHPYCHDFFETKDESIYRLSDKLKLTKFHRTTLFNEFYRLFEGEAQIASVFRLSPKSLVTCSFHRPKIDFTDSEVEMLRIITPHLKAAFRNANEFQRIENERKYLSDAVTRGLVIFDSEGEVAFTNEIADRIFEAWFKDHARGDVIPEVLQRFIRTEGEKFRDDDYHRPPEPLTICRDGSRLTIRLSMDVQSNELTLLLEEKRETSKEDLRRLGLSERESQILFWMSKGKADREIAVLCDISHRTVEKHAENLYTKLGVENRLAAVTAAMDRLGSF